MLCLGPMDHSEVKLLAAGSGMDSFQGDSSNCQDTTVWEEISEGEVKSHVLDNSALTLRYAILSVYLGYSCAVLRT